MGWFGARREHCVRKTRLGTSGESFVPTHPALKPGDWARARLGPAPRLRSGISSAGDNRASAASGFREILPEKSALVTPAELCPDDRVEVLAEQSRRERAARLIRASTSRIRTPDGSPWCGIHHEIPGGVSKRNWIWFA